MRAYAWLWLWLELHGHQARRRRRAAAWLEDVPASWHVYRDRPGRPLHAAACPCWKEAAA